MSIYDYLFRFVVSPIHQKLNGKAANATLSQLQQDLSLADNIQTLQTERLKDVLHHAYQNSVFWRERFDEYQVEPSQVDSISALRELPILTKDIIRNQLERISATNYHESRVSATTGGSTASPMKFYRDRRCADFREAVRAFYWKSIGKQPYDRWANIWGAMSDLGNYSTFKNRLLARFLRRVVMLPSNLLDERSIRKFAKELSRFRPKLIHGYSQAMFLFAKLLQDQGLGIPDSVEAISTTAEPLHEDQKTLIEEVSGKPVYRVYGTREFGFIGGELPNKEGLVVNPLNTIIEIVDSVGKPVVNGERGQILITDLVNYATPLIRYHIGDIGTWNNEFLNQQCWQSISIDAGRETDFIVSEQGRLVGGASLTLINAAGINQLQYIQETKDQLVIRYVPNDRFQSGDIDSLQKQIKSVVGNLQLRFEECGSIEPTRSGKFRYVFSEASRQILGIRQTKEPR